MVLLQVVVVLGAILIGARLGGVGLGVMGGLGLALLTFVFGLNPTSPPIDVMLMIVAVITAAATMQAAGGMEWLVRMAEMLLRKNPSRITFMAPLVTYLFTLFAGTGHTAYSVLPVIAEVSREAGIRPERPMSIAVIASQQAITASPISAATVALLGLLAAQNPAISLFDILKVCVPATLVGVMAGALAVFRKGRELNDDPTYRERLDRGEIEPVAPHTQKPALPASARTSVWIFLAAALAIVLVGSVPALRPLVPDLKDPTALVPLGMPYSIEMIMLSASALMLLLCRVKAEDVVKGSVFPAGMAAVIAIFGIAWMGDTFIAAHIDSLKGAVEGLVRTQPWVFAIALFVMSILLYSQAATIRALAPLGIALGIPAPFMIAMFPAVNGYFFIPNYPTVVAAINFDRTGTTGIGRYLLNHSFMLPGLVATVVTISTGFLLATLLF